MNLLFPFIIFPISFHLCYNLDLSHPGSLKKILHVLCRRILTITSPFLFLLLFEKYRILLRKLFDKSILVASKGFLCQPYFCNQSTISPLLFHLYIRVGWTERGFILYWVLSLSFSCHKLLAFYSNSCNFVRNFLQVILIVLFLQVLFIVFLRFWLLSILLKFSQGSSLNTVESIISSHHTSPYHSTSFITWTSPTVDLFRRSCMCCEDSSSTL